MFSTKVDICNAAFGAIGASGIASFEEDSPNAERCRALYDQSRLSLLRDHPWSCAKKRAILSPVSTYPTFGYARAFPLPRDYIRIISANTEQYEVENRYILANQQQIYLEYIFDNDNEETWDPMLCEALSLKLAARLSKPVTGSDASGESAKAELVELLKRARAINAQERPSQDMQYADSYYIGSRY